MNKVYVLIHVDDNDETDVKVFKSKDMGIAYAMEYIFGEDWESQISDEEWENQGSLLDAEDALENDYGYTDDNGDVWELKESDIIV